MYPHPFLQHLPQLLPRPHLHPCHEHDLYIDRQLVIWTKNARVNSHDRNEVLLAELEQLELDFIFFSETRTTSETTLLDDSHKLFSTSAEGAASGVAILVHQRWLDHIKHVHRINDRLIAMDIQLDHSISLTRMISLYFPHSGHPISDLENSLQQLDALVSEAQSLGYKVLIGGDLNISLCNDERRLLLEELNSMTHLVLINDPQLFPLDLGWTYSHQLTGKRQIDYLICAREFTINTVFVTNDLNLASDHRAVCACLSPYRQHTKRWKKPRPSRGWIPSNDFANNLEAALQMDPPNSLDGLRDLLARVSRGSTSSPSNTSFEKLHTSQPIKDLIAARKSTVDPHERKEISKQLTKDLRKLRRSYSTKKIKLILEEFKHLQRTPRVHEGSSKRLTDKQCSVEEFAIFFRDIYPSTGPIPNPCKDAIRELPRFTIDELQQALTKMSRKKCSDSYGVVVEMMQNATQSFHEKYLELINDMISAGSTNPSWRSSLFSLLPKSGEVTSPTNWRPIVILEIFYKDFARMIYNRIITTLDTHQCSDQFGFRPKHRIECALLILECLISKSQEWNMPLWIASLDLKKAFGRVRLPAIVSALESHGIGDSMIHTLKDLYSREEGRIDDQHCFPINRGVKQGDIVSPVIFNAALETAFKRWKHRLLHHGLLLNNGSSRITNIRYADDILRFVKSLYELKGMLELLHEELARIGLEMHEKKTKRLTFRNDSGLNFVNIHGLSIDILDIESSHAYVGIKLSFSTHRVATELENRIRTGWSKYSKWRKDLCNRELPVHLRIQLFDSIIAPSIVYGLSSCPLSIPKLRRLEALQQQMLRNIVGRGRYQDEAWDETMRRMKYRVDSAMQSYQSIPWVVRIFRQQWKRAIHISRLPASSWQILAHVWNPCTQIDQVSEHHPFRHPGRSRLRWDDRLNEFCMQFFDVPWIDFMKRTPARELDFLTDQFVSFVVSN